MSSGGLFYLNKLVFSCAVAVICRSFDGMNTVTAFYTLDKMSLAGVGAGINKVDAGLIDGNGVCGNEDTDVSNTRVFGNCAAVTVHTHIFHYVDVKEVALKVFYNRARRIRHRLKEGIVVGGPYLFGIACAVNICLAE